MQTKGITVVGGEIKPCMCGCPSRSYLLRRLLDLLKGHSSKQSRFIRLNQECKRDIEWWKSFLPSRDRVYFFDLPDWATVPDLFLSTEASGSLGYGAFYADEWFNGSWSATQRSLSTACKELFSIFIACYVWGDKLRYNSIQCCCDKQSVVAVISSDTSKDSRLMQLLRELFLCAARFNMKVTAKHVPGIYNAIADAFSRFNMQVFRQLVPKARPTPTSIPPALLARLSL